MANTALIETADILRVVGSNEEVYLLSNGRQMIKLFLILNPASGKTYLNGEYPQHIRMGDATYAIERIVDLDVVPKINGAYAGFAKETAQGTPVDTALMDNKVAAITAAAAPQGTPDAPTETEDTSAQNAAEQAPETPTTADLETPAEVPTPLSTTPIIVTMKDA